MSSVTPQIDQPRRSFGTCPLTPRLLFSSLSDLAVIKRCCQALVICWCLWSADRCPSSEPDFGREIRPILSDACFHCHGPDGEAREGGLRLDLRSDALESGVLTSGEMLERLTSLDPDVRMPPPDSNRVLNDEARGKLRGWILKGARWPEDDRHWAFVAPERPLPPAVDGDTWSRNDIDRFVLDKLKGASLEPSAEADRGTLLRRLSFDLTGLPPTIEALDAFLEDSSPDAYEKVVDRLLQSPRFGEHQAVDWLDASRFADTDGYQNDRLRYMWVWRDWLIDAINQNLPFDEFIINQMAGDLLPDRNFVTQVATGFQRNHRINSEGGSIPDEWIVEYVADRVETTGTVFLGLTFNCARCHDHKYDPISQRDFYQLFAFFNSIDEAGLGPNNGNSPPFVPVPTGWPNLKEHEREFVEPEPMRIKVVQTSVPRPQPGGEQTVMVMHQAKEARPTYRLIRGQYDQPDRSEALVPRVPDVIGGWQKDWPADRLGLAKWLTSPEHPLTGRVTVNRFWQHYFGTGLVKTSENFGVQGDPPSHPELLDFLATEFVQTGWDVKRMHRLIVTSATYRQQSKINDRLREADPDNRLLARGPRERLSPFMLRDAALSLSGLMSDKIGGPSVKPYMPPGIWSSISNSKYKQDKGEKLYRRSLYTYWRRTLPPPTMMTFNAAGRETCAVRSDLTNTPLQALTLMNNVVFVEASRHLAERMIAQSADDRQRIETAFRLATSRRPNGREVERLLADLAFFRSGFRERPTAAEQLLASGDSPVEGEADRVEWAAWTLVCNTLLNLDEAITKN